MAAAFGLKCHQFSRYTHFAEHGSAGVSINAFYAYRTSEHIRVASSGRHWRCNAGLITLSAR